MRTNFNSIILGLLLGTTTYSMGQPTITTITLKGMPQTPYDTYHPYATNSLSPNLTYSASPGADLILTAHIIGTPPFHFQWQFNYTDLPGQTASNLVLTNAQMTNGGDFTVIVTNAAGSDSQVATLLLDPTFTKITTGPIVTNGGYCVGSTWGDCNNSGYPDLFIYNGATGQPLHPFLYRNHGEGNFTSVSTGLPASAMFESFSACWGDYLNNGRLDLFVSTTSSNVLFRNEGNGIFSQVFDSPVVQMSNIGTWVDYDRDGWLDLFLSGSHAKQGPGAHNFIFRNNGDGTFSPVTNTVTTDLGSFLGGAWADVDNNGYPDLFVASDDPLQPNRLYLNNGDGTFTRVMYGDLATDLAGHTQGYAFADYDGDGLPDLFIASLDPQGNVLYHNDGNGVFSRVIGDPTGGNDLGSSASCTWVDYDCDGFLDLFVTCGAPPGVATVFLNLLYHNNGDGTFTKVTLGSPVNEYSTSFGCSWVDYDCDGFPDLFATLQDQRGAYLYHNNGNSNGWLTVKLVGTASNRAAIGAKVRVKATYAGASRWQMRQITGGSGYIGHNELLAHFGLGDATNIDLVQIEWPSGIVQALTNVVPRTALQVVEHQQVTPSPARPGLTGIARNPDGGVSLTTTGDPELLYVFEASTNLIEWSWLGVRSNATGSVQFTDSKAANYTQRYYRVSIP